MLKNLKELIKEHNIQTIDALEQLKSDLLKENDSREFCKKYGIDHSSIEFTFHQEFYRCEPWSAKHGVSRPR
ncbi:hypothetical protein [Piscirickettsia salmonis]|uniref:hypothetical protein n=1 Tax=Piscirickettsia salmonis TaxID=1238 RepID=UPI000AD53A3F|nr:hypothetical protein [Piscirickettsia salmonis]QHS26846.1 hypothetical protein GW538_14165 [Piscirickettsia salmonis]